MYSRLSKFFIVSQTHGPTDGEDKSTLLFFYPSYPRKATYLSAGRLTQACDSGSMGCIVDSRIVSGLGRNSKANIQF